MSTDPKPSAARVLARYNEAATLAPPRESATAAQLKRVGLAPGRMWAFGGEPTFEVDERASVVNTGDLVQDKRGKVSLFVGLDSTGGVVLARDEAELKRAQRILKKERLRFQSVSHLASWVPGQIIQEGWESGGLERQLLEDGDGSQVPPARDDDGNEVPEKLASLRGKSAIVRSAMQRWAEKRSH